MDPSAPQPSRTEPIDKDIVAQLKIESRKSGTDFFPKYLHYFREDLVHAEQDLDEVVSEKNAEPLLQIAHRLRGTASNFGAHPLVGLCLRVEALIKDNRGSEALGVVPALLAELQRVQQAVRKLRN